MVIAPLDLLVLALACWRLAHLLVNEDGPYNVFARLRKLPYPFGKRTTAEGRLDDGALTCIYCCSVWAAGVVLVLWLTPLAALDWLLAVSAAALMLGTAANVNFEE